MSWPAILVILLGFLFIVLIGFSFMREGAQSGSTRNRSEEQTAAAMPAVPCPPEVLERIFDREDSDFIAREHSRGAQELFHRERKRLAYLWLRQTRHEIANVRRYHAEIARKSTDLNPGTEIKIAVDCLLVSGMCWLMAVAIYFLGPIHTRGMARYVSDLSTQLWGLAGKSAGIPQSPSANLPRIGG
ncbi:MAG: hypothetical protein LAN61_01190 [Acidobacteriia bacterium]|nr:hypothetical protein [Terriglobia bacterium]